MGLLNLQVVRRIGSRVIVVGHHEERLEMARRLGAHLVINSLETDPYEVVMRGTDGYGADAFILAINNMDAMSSALKIVSRGGRINVFAGAHPEYEMSINPNKIHYNEITMMGSTDGLRRHYYEALRLIESGDLRPSLIITHAYPLEKIGEAMNTAQKRTTIKIIVKP